MNYHTTLLITVVILGFAASTFARKYVGRLDRLCSFWRFLIVVLIADIAVSALGYLFSPKHEPEQWVRWQVWSHLAGGSFLAIAVLRLAQSLVDFDFLRLPVESGDPTPVDSESHPDSNSTTT